MSSECCHFRSTMVVKTSCRNRPWNPGRQTLSSLLCSREGECLAAVYLLSDVLVSHIAGSGLGDEAGSLGFGATAVGLVLILRQPGQQEAIW